MLSFVIAASKWWGALGLWAGASLGIAHAQPPKARPTPPRTDGIHFGASLEGHGNWIQVAKEQDTNLYPGGALSIWVGEQVMPWLALGLRIGFGRANYKDRSVGSGWLQLDAGFYPFHQQMPRELQLSFRVRTGLGGGFVTIPGESGRKGYGGAALGGAVRLEWFPWARCKRPREGGGFALAPELGLSFFPRVSSDASSGISAHLGLAAVYHFGS